MSHGSFQGPFEVFSVAGIFIRSFLSPVLSLRGLILMQDFPQIKHFTRVCSQPGGLFSQKSQELNFLADFYVSANFVEVG